MKRSLPSPFLLLLFCMTAIFFSNHCGTIAAPTLVTNTDLAKSLKAVRDARTNIDEFLLNHRRVTADWKAKSGPQKSEAKSHNLQEEKKQLEDGLRITNEAAALHRTKAKQVTNAADKRGYEERAAELEKEAQKITNLIVAQASRKEKRVNKGASDDAYRLLLKPSLEHLRLELSGASLDRERFNFPRTDKAFIEVNGAYKGICDIERAMKAAHEIGTLQRSMEGRFSKAEREIGAQGQAIKEALHRMLDALKRTRDKSVLSADVKTVLKAGPYFEAWHLKLDPPKDK